MKPTAEQMDASQVFCPNLAWVARGQVGQGNIVSHGKARARYRCKTCGKTWSRAGRYDVRRIAQTEGVKCHGGHTSGVWLPDPGDCASVWPGRTHGGEVARSSREPLPRGPSGRGAPTAPGSGARAGPLD